MSSSDESDAAATDDNTAMALRQLGVRGDGLLDGLPVGVCIWDRDGKLAQCNRRAIEILGHAPAAGDLAPEDALGAGRAIRDREMPIERPDGSGIIVLVNLEPLRDGNGALIGAINCFQDVTELKRTQDRLRAREHWYRALLEALPAAIYTTDAAGRLTFYNPAAVALAGKRPELGSDRWCVTWRLYHPDGTPMPHDECPMAVTLKENRPVTGAEAVAERPDGSRVPILPFPTPLRDERGMLVGAVNMLVDISERRAADAERQRLIAELRHLTETLERRVEERSRALVAEIEGRQAIEAQLHQLQKIEAIGQLTGGVAHDFNNLLTAVMGNLDFITEKSKDPDIRRHAAAAVRAARRGANLTQQLLAFSRKQRLEPRCTSINELVTGMGEMLQRALGGTIRVELALSQALWPALIDPNQIKSAILNLAINARDAMPDGGTVTLETGNVQIGKLNRVAGLEAGDFILIAVTDTGTGMTEEVRAKAFDPFFTTKRIGKGSGLGLSQVHGVAQQSGGGVALESAPGRGTTVRVYLPRAREEAPATRREAATIAAPASGRGRRVLVVDDDPDVREVVVASLNGLGYEVVAVASGEAAINALTADAFDLVVMDVAMPEMNGAEAGRRVKARWPDIPVLYISGCADPPALGEHIAEGFLLRKPFVAADLAAKLHHILDRPAAPRGAKVVTLIRDTR